MSTGPIDRNGCPNARTELPSTQVTVPVADSTMSPDSSTAATAEPGSSRAAGAEGSVPAFAAVPVVAAAGADAPEGATSQFAASATSPKTRPETSEPERDTG